MNKIKFIRRKINQGTLEEWKLKMFLDIAGMRDIDGHTAGRKKKQKEHDFLYWEFNETNQIGVRMGDWKMVVKKGVPFLYNLATDIHEDNNVADQHPEIVEKMKAVIFAQHTPNPHFSVTLPEKK